MKINFIFFIVLSNFGLACAQEVSKHIIPFPLGTVITLEKDSIGQIYTARLGAAEIRATTGQRYGNWVYGSKNVDLDKSCASKALTTYYNLIWTNMDSEQRLVAMRTLYAMQEAHKENHWQQIAMQHADEAEVNC